MTTIAASEPAAARRPDARRRLSTLRQRLRRHLDEQVLPFWTSPALVDPEHGGGFLVYLDRDLKPTGETTKHLVVHLRMLFAYAVAIGRTTDGARQDALRAEYDRQFRFLVERFWDGGRAGGWYWELSRAGVPLDPAKKMMVGQVYAIYILSELAVRLDHADARAWAERTFDAIEPGGHDDRFGGYFQDHTRPADDPVNLRKSASTNVHMLLALARLHAASPRRDDVRARLAELYDRMPAYVHPSGNGYMALTRDWQPAPVSDAEPRNETTLYGHNAELAWYALDAAAALGRDPAGDWLVVARRIVDAVLRDGASDDGAIWFFGPMRGPSDDRRVFWWSQTEAMVALLRLYERTGDARYLDALESVTDFSFRHLVPDGSVVWLSVVSPDGQLIEGYRGGTNWKVDFHVIRALEDLDRTCGRILGD